MATEKSVMPSTCPLTHLPTHLTDRFSQDDSNTMAIPFPNVACSLKFNSTVTFLGIYQLQQVHKYNHIKGLKAPYHSLFELIVSY